MDREKQKPVLLTANLGRAALLGLVPLLYFTGLLSVGYLCAIAFLAGTCGVFFDLAYQSFLPKLVDRDRLVDANSRVRASGSVADLAGPGIGGFLVQAISAPVAVLADALSFLVSAAWLLRVRVQERTPLPPAGGRNLKREMGEGLRVTFGDRVLRAGACAAATYNLFWGSIEAVLILYMVRRLGMSAGEIGLTFAVGSTGALAGAWVGATGAALSWLWLFFSPLRAYRQLPRSSGPRSDPGSSRVAWTYPGSESARSAGQEA